MQNLSFLKRAYYAYLGRAYAFAYHTRWRRFLGYSLSSWLKFLVTGFFLVAIALAWSPVVQIVLLILMVWLWVSFWWAGRQGFHRFVGDDSIALPQADTVPLHKGRRVSLFASGTYAVSDREETVLLRPSEYWQSQAGEHGVMVNQYAKKYLYQFFKKETLAGVQPGWLIFGDVPMPTLAITFFQTWGPDNADDVSTYTVDGGHQENKNRRKRTIYFTFEETAVQNQVWQTILVDMPERAAEAFGEG